MSTASSTIKRRDDVRNIAIIAHVDHGKTTLVDALLRESGALDSQSALVECVMDSNDLERERGITIFSKCAAFDFEGIHYNIIDTPGHADFGSEVERILKMVDGALVLVDAFEGPLPQTKFVLRKSFELNLRPIVVINKIDRPGARPDEVLNEIFDLFADLNATDEQLDFPVVYASGKLGFATMDPSQPSSSMKPLLDEVRRHVPPPVADETQPLQALITMLDYDSYVGTIAIGRIHAGKIEVGKTYSMVNADGLLATERVTKLLRYRGLRKVEVQSAEAGDVVAVAGFREAKVGTTITSVENPAALDAPKIDEPTISMIFGPNTSPLAGRYGGKFLTSRQIRDRLLREGAVNVGMRIEAMGDSERLKVSGRGELHLSILIETMRREAYEFEVARPEVIFKTVKGERQEPIEHVVIDVDTQYQGPVMEEMGKRKAEMLKMEVSESGANTLMEYYVPSRSLLGFRGQFLTMTRGTGIMTYAFDHYAPFKGEIPSRTVGVLISTHAGTAVAYALHNAQERGPLFVTPNTEVYEGMLIGISNNGHDISINATKQKKLTNIRTHSHDDMMILEPPRVLTLEQALSFIEDDELVEVTPQTIRLRKKVLSKGERRRTGRMEDDEE